MITRENYELFYMDYLEGDLDSTLVQELEGFLEKNPDLTVEEGFLEPLEMETLVYPKKSDLKFESIPEFNKMSDEERIIAYHEGILSLDQRKTVEQDIENSKALRVSFNAYAKVYLIKNNTIYTNKSKLKKKNTLILWPLITAAAASFALLFFLNTEIAGPEKNYAGLIETEELGSENSTEEEILAETPKVSVDLSASDNEHNTIKSKKALPVSKARVKVTPTTTLKEEKIEHLDLRKISLDLKPENLHLQNSATYRVERSNPTQMTVPVAKSVTMENVLPPVVNYAVAEVTDSKVQIKKESHKKLNEGAKYFIKLGPIEITKK